MRMRSVNTCGTTRKGWWAWLVRTVTLYEPVSKMSHALIGRRVWQHALTAMHACAAGGGENLNASQFYITLGTDLDSLDEKHTIFGEVNPFWEYSWGS